ncbi:unnamed protein product [Schistosoma curassoni]|uniref:Dynein light intermediate chain n=1 Tax=Schistosoma curassoni TaxID=6186 RepID=A0A183KY11_9TREM|nr:unnamed protein product [Schistosoma curassoni]
MCISPSGNHQPNGLVSPKKLSGIHPATAALLSSTLNSLSETASQPPSVINVEQANISMETNTDENALINNLGIPIVVVMTKADSMGALEKENQFTEEHFDFIQMHVRRFCLSCISRRTLPRCGQLEIDDHSYTSNSTQDHYISNRFPSLIPIIPPTSTINSILPAQVSL